MIARQRSLGAGGVRGDSPESCIRTLLTNQFDLAGSTEERDLLYTSALDQEFRNDRESC